MIFKKIIYIGVLFLIIYSCETKKSQIVEHKQISLDAEKTQELIFQILEDEQEHYFSTDCVSETSLILALPMVSDFKKYVQEHLEIKDTIHLNTQLEAYYAYKITPELVPNKKVLTQDSLKKLEHSNVNFFDWLDKNCSRGYCALSKPIFNETYTLAYVKIGVICGGLCGGGEKRIYEFSNGKWIIKINIGTWVS